MFALKVNFSVIHTQAEFKSLWTIYNTSSVIVCFICVYIFIHRKKKKEKKFLIVLYFRDSSTVFVSVAL